MQDDGLSSSAPEVRLPDAWPPRVMGFDGDDTLWHNEPLFSTQGRLRMLLMHHVDLPSTLIDARLTEMVQRNLALYGHGIKVCALDGGDRHRRHKRAHSGSGHPHHPELRAHDAGARSSWSRVRVRCWRHYERAITSYG